MNQHHLLAAILLFVVVAISHSASVIDVVQPIDAPENTVKCTQHENTVKCTQHVRDISFSGSSPFLQSSYTPSTTCGSSWAKIVLQLRGSCKGILQEQKIGGVWLGGAQILHTSTPLPSLNGTNWIIQSDATSYERLFKSANFLATVFLDTTSSSSRNSSLLAAAYNISIDVIYFSYYSNSSDRNEADQRSSNVPIARSSSPSAGLFQPPVVVPIHPQVSPSNDTGFWFEIRDDKQSSAMVTVPSNAIKVFMLVFLSAHEDDEFWYRTNSRFREVEIAIDGTVVDAIWPQAVIYSGGMDPKYWQSVGSIGALNSAGYELVLDAFLSVLADGRQHEIGFRIINATKTWFLGANFVILTSDDPAPTRGLIHSHDSGTKVFQREGLVLAARRFSSTGYKFVRGVNVTTTVQRRLGYNRWKNNEKFQLLTDSRMEFVEQAGDNSFFLSWLDKTSASLVIAGGGQVDLSHNHTFDSVLTIGDNHGQNRGGNFTGSTSNHQAAGSNGTYQMLSSWNTFDNCYSRELLVANYVYQYDNVSTSCPRSKM